MGHLEAIREKSMRGRRRNRLPPKDFTCAFRLPPKDFTCAFRQPLKNPRLYLEAMKWIQVNPPPNYTCPFCHQKLTRKPIHDFTLQTIVDGFGHDGGETAGGFFDKYFLF